MGLASSRLIAYVVHAMWTLAFTYHVLHTRKNLSPSEPTVVIPADVVGVE